MLVQTLRKEWLEAYREERVYWLSIAVLVLMTAVMIAGWYNHQTVLQQKQQVAQSERTRWLEQGDKGPHSAAHYGVYAIKPGSPLAVVEPGLNNYLGHALMLEAHKQNDALFRPVQDRVPMQRFGELTPGFAIQILLPLLVILIGFHSLAGERESGTLKQLLVAGASPGALFWSKAGFLLSASFIFLAPTIIYLLFAAPFSHHEFTAQDWFRSIVIVIAYIAYLVIWVLLTLIVSAFLRSSRITLVTLLMLWGSVCLLVPRVAMEWSAQSVHLDSARLFQSRMETEIYTPERLQAIETYKQNTLQEYGVDDVSDLPFDWSGAQLQFGEEYGNKIFDRLYSQRAQAMDEQSSRYALSGLISPMVNLQLLTMGAATTDLIHHQLFDQVAEKHRRTIQRIMNTDLMHNAQHADGHYQAGRSLWQQVPEFNYHYPGFFQLVSHYAKTILFFIGWLVLALVGALMAVKRLAAEGRS